MRALLVAIIVAPIITSCLVNTPTPTATPWPTETPAEKYCRQFRRITYLNDMASRQLQQHQYELKTNPSLATDYDWKLESESVRVSYEAVSKAIKGAEPPASAISLHEKMLGVAEALDAAAAKYGLLFDAADADGVIEIMLAFSDNMDEAMSRLDAALPDLEEACGG